MSAAPASPAAARRVPGETQQFSRPLDPTRDKVSGRLAGAGALLREERAAEGAADATDGLAGAVPVLDRRGAAVVAAELPVAVDGLRRDPLLLQREPRGLPRARGR